MSSNYERTRREEKRLLENYKRGMHPSSHIGIRPSQEPMGGGVGTPPSHLSREDFRVLKEHGSLDPATRIPPTGRKPIIRADHNALLRRHTFHPDDALTLSQAMRSAIKENEAKGWLAYKQNQDASWFYNNER